MRTVVAVLAIVAAAGSARAKPACDQGSRGFINTGVDLGSSFGTATSWTGPEPAGYDLSLPTLGARLALGLRPLGCMQLVGVTHAWRRDEGTTPTGAVMSTRATATTAQIGFRFGDSHFEMGASFGAGIGRARTTLRGADLERRVPLIEGHLEVVIGGGAVAALVYLNITQWFVDEQFADYYVPRIGGYALGVGIHHRF